MLMRALQFCFFRFFCSETSFFFQFLIIVYYTHGAKRYKRLIACVVGWFKVIGWLLLKPLLKN